MGQESGKLLKKLVLLTSQEQYLDQFQQRLNQSQIEDWPPCRIDFETDSALLLEAAEAKEEQQ